MALGTVVPLGTCRHCVSEVIQDGEEHRCDPRVIWGQPRAPSASFGWHGSGGGTQPSFLVQPQAILVKIPSGWFCLCTLNPAQG